MSRDVVAAVAKAEESFGMLVANHHEYESLYRALRSGEHAFELVPSILPRMIRQGTWMDRLDPDLSRRTRLKAIELIRFVEDPPPVGLGSSVREVSRYLAADPESLKDFQKAINRGRGGNNNPSGINQHSEANSNNVTIDLPSAALVVHDDSQQTAMPGPMRGNAAGYAVRKLADDRPDLFERVKAKEITPNAAMIQAGYRKPTIQIPADPAAAGKRLARHFTPEQFEELGRAFLAARGDVAG